MNAKRPSVLDQYFPESDAERPQPASSLVADGYVAMLEFELRNGNRIALPYTTLLRVLYNPSAGINLTFSTDDVQITGRNLDALVQGIVQHRVPKIVVARSRDGFATDTAGDPVVTAVTVTPTG